MSIISFEDTYKSIIYTDELMNIKCEKKNNNSIHIYSIRKESKICFIFFCFFMISTYVCDKSVNISAVMYI